ncbi:DNA repair protein RecO [uncultured Parolsenella sp.]|uniref:DNA repair protein RecO n=1 Tax=uncultured Parolsenella sp. TaxID=2083008 RepID=UPI0027D94A09|nr:DNA repair protein RecO [uncultured Parolsenella sp.]
MARGKTRHTGAIVIDRTKLGESDLILTLLETDGSQGRAVAKGARKPGGRLAARVQLFSELDLLLALGHNLDVVAEAQLTDPHEALRGDLDRLSAASVVCECARLTSFPDAPDAFLAPICSRALRACEEADGRAHLDVAAAAYVLKVLSHQGWRPVLDACVACGETPVTRFSALAGGALCESCARNVEGAELVDGATLGWLAALVGLTFDELLASPVDADTAARLLAIAHVWAATHLDARMRAMEFALSV